MGNFWGDFAGAFQKSYFASEENKRQNAVEQRDKARFEHDQQQWKDEDVRKEHIAAAGWAIDNPNDPTGLINGDAYKAMSAAPTKQSKTPSAMPSNGEAPPAPAAPSASDYVPVEMNGQVMYAPKSRAKMKDPSAYVADVGRVMMSVDPTVGANMMAAAQTLESNNLKLSSQKWGQSVVEAQRLGGDAGLQALSKSFDALPDGQSVQWSRDKDGSVHLKFYADTQGGPVQTSDRVFKGRQGVTAEQEVFEYAGALANPEAMSGYLTKMAQAAQQEFTNVLAKREDSRAERRLGLDAQQVGISAFNSAENARHNRAMEAATGGTGATSISAKQYRATMGKLDTAAHRYAASVAEPNTPEYAKAYNAQIAAQLSTQDPAFQEAFNAAHGIAEVGAPTDQPAAAPPQQRPAIDPAKALPPGAWVSPVTGRIMGLGVAPARRAAGQDAINAARNATRVGGAIGQQLRAEFKAKYHMEPDALLQAAGGK